MINFIKNFIYSLINFLFRQKGMAILMYHSVDNNEIFFTVKPKIFARQMAYLKKRNYRVISLEKLVNYLESGEKIPQKTVVLTFDDGYQDNYFNAFPILKKHNFPATIFLTTGSVGKKMNNAQNIPLKILNWQEIDEMHRSGLIDFQPHTVNHQESNKQEIIDSKKEIEKKLNKKCKFFAYPRGLYNDEIIDILKNNRFKAARTLENGKVNQGDNLFKLKRISVNSTTSFIQFRANL